jgi:hypothetical protein
MASLEKSLAPTSSTRRATKRQKRDQLDIRQLADQIYDRTGGPSPEIKELYRAFKNKSLAEK